MDAIILSSVLVLLSESMEVDVSFIVSVKQSDLKFNS